MTKEKQKSKIKAARKALADLGLDLPEINFITRDALYELRTSTIHEVDRTPVIFDPAFGRGGIRERCVEEATVDHGGRAVTDETGIFRWRPSDFICGSLGVTKNISFVATALATQAIVMTCLVTPGENGGLGVDVFSWDTNGDPAPNTRFSWRAWAERQPIVVD